MADRHGEDPIAPRRSLGGPILPPPPPELAQEKAKAEAAEAAKREKKAQAAARRREAAQKRAAQKAQKQAEQQKAAQRTTEQPAQQRAAELSQASPQKPAPSPRTTPSTPPSRATSTQAPAARTGATTAAARAAKASQRRRRARLRLVQVDAWSVMKTAFLLSIALGIVLVVAVAVVWSVLGSAGVWDSINSSVQQAIGGDGGGSQFQIQDYLGTSRVVGFTMIVAVIDVILVTAIATLGAFLYNLAAALLGGVEVTLTEDH